MSNILLKITGDNDDAKEVIDDTEADIEEFKKAGDDAEVTLKVDADQAKEDIASVVAELEAIPKEYTIRIRVAAEQAKLQEALADKARVENLLSQANASGDETDPLIKRLGVYSTRIDNIRSRVEGLSRDFDSAGEDGERAFSPFDKAMLAMLSDTDELGTSVGRLGGIFDNFGSRVGKVRTGLLGLVGDLTGKIPLIGGLFKGAFGIVEKVSQQAEQGLGSFVAQIPAAITGFAEAAPVIAVVAAAISALVVSIGEALVGIAALGIAFLAALGPIAILLGAVLIKIKDIVSGENSLVTAQNNLKTATTNYASAVTQLRADEQTENNERLAALQAQKQAVLALTQAEESLASDKTNVKQAALNVAEAKTAFSAFNQQLAGMGISPSDLFGKANNVSVKGNFGQTQQGIGSQSWLEMMEQWESLQLAVTEAEEQYKDSQTQVVADQLTYNSAKQSANEYDREGYKAYQPYASAVEQVAKDLTTIKDDSLAIKSATIAIQTAMAHGAGEASGFEKAWKALKSTLGEILGPGESAVFGGIEQAMGIMAKGLKPLTPAFTALGKAIGNSIVWFAKMMVKPDNMKLLRGLIYDSAKLVPVIWRWLGAIMKLILIIAEGGAKSLLGMFKHWTKELEKVEKHPKKIREFIHECVEKATEFWHGLLKVGKAVVKIGDFFKTVESIVQKLLGPFEKLGKLLGIGGTAGGIIGALGLLAGFKGLGGAGGVLGRLGSLGGGGVGTGVLAVGAAGAGWEIGKQIDKIPGVESTVGGAFSALGLTGSTNPAAYAQKYNDNDLIAHIQKELKTGLYQLGPNVGKVIGASARKALINELYTDQAHNRGSQIVQTNHYNIHQAQDSHHLARVIAKQGRKRLSTLGGGVR